MKYCLLVPALLVPALLAFALPGRALTVEETKNFEGGDVVFADFEGEDYGPWKVEGEAFGAGPAHGALPGQMAVEGFVGKGLVNSFNHGDDATGTLTSPEFKIERRAISMLIGGGGYEGKTCVNLLVDGQVVRTAVGPNTVPGGSERLESQGWDVAELRGKMGRLQIVDAAKGSWGHINVDQIVFTDTKPPGVLRPATRELTLEKRYLLLPVKTGAKKHRVALLVEGKVVRDFEIELADDPQWWAQVSVSAWRGKTATLRVDWLPEDAKALASVEQSDTLWHADEIYHEPQRAQFHFSPRRGWNNDPNGMVAADGEYHLYFQHNPYGWNWGNMHWGHAVSPDMVHWREEAIALYPPAYDDMAFSGSAVVDKLNTSGWRKGDPELLVAAFTSTGRGECIVYSNDKGRTWQEYEGNPVVKHTGRDPRLLWHEPTKQWVMAVYDEAEKKQWIAFYTSPDLKTWTFASRIEGFFECPDFFELPVDGGEKKWVLTAASSEYRVGTFDGKTFTPETPKLPGHRGKGFYAAQTFSDEPKGRRVQIGWLQTATPGAAFNQGMSLPNELTLHATPDGPRLAWQPVKELESLRNRQTKISGGIGPGESPLLLVGGELLEIRAEVEPGKVPEFGFNVRGVKVSYDVKKQEINVNGQVAPAPLRKGRLTLIIYADRTSLEVFASDGLTYVPMPLTQDPENKSVTAFAKTGTAKLISLTTYELKPIWAPVQP